MSNQPQSNILSDAGMLEVFSNKYYSGQKWEPKKGDYYVIGRNTPPHTLCKVVDVKDDAVVTTMSGYPEVSYWPKEDFLIGFGINRLHVPEYMFNYSYFFVVVEEKEAIKEEVEQSPTEKLKEASDSLVKYLNDMNHPHVKVIVDCTGAELLEGTVSVANNSHIKD